MANGEEADREIGAPRAKLTAGWMANGEVAIGRSGLPGEKLAAGWRGYSGVGRRRGRGAKASGSEGRRYKVQKRARKAGVAKAGVSRVLLQGKGTGLKTRHYGA